MTSAEEDCHLLEISPGNFNIFFIFFCWEESVIMLSGRSPIWLSAAFSQLWGMYPTPAVSAQGLLP